MKIKNDTFIPLCGVVSVLGGFLNGLIGTGAGIIYVFLFSLIYSKDKTKEKKDVFASCLISTLPVSITSSLIYSKSFFSAGENMLYLIPSAALGGICGAFFLNKTNNGTLVRIFAFLTGVSGVIMICKAM